MRIRITGKKQVCEFGIRIPVYRITGYSYRSRNCCRNAPKAIRLRRNNYWNRGCINNLNDEGPINIVKALIHKRITLIPILQVYIKLFSYSTGCRDSDNISKCTGIWRCKRTQNRSHITIGSICYICATNKHISGNCVCNGSRRCFTVNKLNSTWLVIIIIRGKKWRRNNWILAVPDTDIPQNYIMFSSFTDINYIHVTRSCLLHLKQTVTIKRSFTSVHNKHTLYCVEFVAWVFYGPCPYVSTVYSCGIIMQLYTREVIIGSRSISPYGRSVTPVNCPLATCQNTCWK